MNKKKFFLSIVILIVLFLVYRSINIYLSDRGKLKDFEDKLNKIENKINDTEKKIDELIDFRKKASSNNFNKLNEKLDFLNLDLKKLYLDKHAEVINYNNSFKINKLNLNLPNTRPVGYFDFYKDKIILSTGEGSIYFINNGSKNKIQSNLKSFNIFDKNEGRYFNNFIRDILILDDSIYVVFIKKKRENNKYRYSSEVLKAEINFKNLIFENFFTSGEFVSGEEVDLTHGGGRLIKYKNGFAFSVPDFNKLELIQDDNSIFGKILYIDNEGNFKIISKGHRNPQGLYFDDDRDLLLSSEHGPAGGDEINIIVEGGNYGWPEVSYGVGDSVLSHDHEEKGYNSPLKTWDNNPGVSELTKITSSKNIFFNNYYVLSSLSGQDDRYGNHLYLFTIKKDGSAINNLEKLYLNMRIRDLKFNVSNSSLYVLTEGGGGLNNTGGLYFIDLGKN